MSVVEYADVQQSTPTRDSIARTLFQLGKVPHALAWRILPRRHPVRIYAEGRTDQVSGAIEEALDAPQFRATSWAVKLSLTMGLFGFGTIADVLNLNPISNLFGL